MQSVLEPGKLLAGSPWFRNSVLFLRRKLYLIPCNIQQLHFLLSTGEEEIVVAAQAYSYETNPCIGYIINR